MTWTGTKQTWIAATILLGACSVGMATFCAPFGMPVQMLMSASDNADWQSVLSALGALGAAAAGLAAGNFTGPAVWGHDVPWDAGALSPAQRQDLGPTVLRFDDWFYNQTGLHMAMWDYQRPPTFIDDPGYERQIMETPVFDSHAPVANWDGPSEAPSETRMPGGGTISGGSIIARDEP